MQVLAGYESTEHEAFVVTKRLVSLQGIKGAIQEEQIMFLSNR